RRLRAVARTSRRLPGRRRPRRGQRRRRRRRRGNWGRGEKQRGRNAVTPPAPGRGGRRLVQLPGGDPAAPDSDTGGRRAGGAAPRGGPGPRALASRRAARSTLAAAVPGQGR
ncbi:unnamed protein product, partial [Ectocarpus sp. 12 AP-2014]